MKNRNSKANEKREKSNGSQWMMKKKNMTRLGGGGLSLQAFANAKTKDTHYNPAFIKKQREFYKNAKYVHKYKKSLQPQSGQTNPSSASRPVKGGNETGEAGQMSQNHKENKKNSSRSLKELYEKKHEQEEKERTEREAIFRGKEEARERALSQRKSLREKMLKKTWSGQPVMKHRIEHLLETLQHSAN